MKFKILIFFLFVTFFGKAQTGVFYTVKNLTYSNGRVSAINALGKVIFQVNCKDMIYYQQQDLTIGVFDYQTLTSRIFINSQITSPAYSAVIDSLKSWQLSCNGEGESMPIPLIVDNIGVDTVRVLDSVRVWFDQSLDTSNQGILNSIFGTLIDSLDKDVYLNNDSLRVYFNQISDTANQAILLDIHNLLVDSLDKDIYLLNDSLRVYFKDLPFIADTSNQGILNAIHDILVDSLDKDLYVLNDSIKVWFSQPIETKTDTANNAVLNAIHNLLADSLDKNLFVLNDSIKVWFTQPLEVKTDTANQGILNDIHNLLVDSLDKDLYILNDSIRVYFEKDTIDYEYKSFCYRSKLDSGVYSFNVLFNVLTPNTPSFINFTDVDSLNSLFEIDYRTGATFGTFPNIQQDFVPCERWDEIGVKTDTLKALSFTAIAKVRTNIDTLFNCKSLSFGRKSNASGTLVLTFENGETESFDVANDDLPNWVNGEFITQITYDATGAVGLIVNSLGCSQTSDNICAKVKPIFDCDTVTPITCNGWQSASGVWQTISGCWNTGQ